MEAPSHNVVSKINEAQAKAESELFQNSREHLIAMEIQSLRSATATLCFAWFDRENRKHIRNELPELIEHRDHLSRLIEKAEATTAPGIEAAE